MAVAVPLVAPGQIETTAVNASLAVTETAVNNADGANLQTRTVAPSKLAKPKAFFTICYSDAQYNWLAANINDFAGWTLPQVDGAANATRAPLISPCSSRFKAW